MHTTISSNILPAPPEEVPIQWHELLLFMIINTQLQNLRTLWLKNVAVLDSKSVFFEFTDRFIVCSWKPMDQFCLWAKCINPNAQNHQIIILSPDLLCSSVLSVKWREPNSRSDNFSGETTKTCVGTPDFSGREKQQSFLVFRSQFSCQMNTLCMLGRLKCKISG